jgi:RNA polymerase sigma-70 factor (ECF subfamily)
VGAAAPRPCPDGPRLTQPRNGHPAPSAPIAPRAHGGPAAPPQAGPHPAPAPQRGGPHPAPAPQQSTPHPAPAQQQGTAFTADQQPEQAEQAEQADDAAEPAGGLDANGLAGWDLVRATQAGDQQAFGQLYDRYHEMVFRYVLFRVGDRQLAEDLTAETFLRALRRIASVSYQGRDIGAWFVTIARNLVLDHVKSSRYRLEQTTSEIADLSPSTSGPEQQVLDGATHEELLRCVAKLNSDQKECIALRFLQGLSVAETARLMNRNEGAVKALQHRAVRRLAQLLPEGLR